MSNFWTTLKRPFLALAPMYDVTDEAFRQMFVAYGKPDVLMTEFVSADGLVNEIGRPKLLRELYFRDNEHPIVAQLFSASPDKIKKAASLISALGFDGLDLNMGCPDKTIMKQGAGANLIKNKTLAQELIIAAKEGAPTLPISVKTRLGYSQPKEWRAWLAALLAVKPAALTVHLRTMKELSLVPAHWDLACEIASTAKAAQVTVLANGDVGSVTEAKTKAQDYGFDGIMVGRGVFGNPAFFADRELSAAEKITALIDHLSLFADLYLPGKTNNLLFGGHTKNLAVMKKHFKAYLHGFAHALALRQEIMALDNPVDIIARLRSEQTKI